MMKAKFSVSLVVLAAMLLMSVAPMTYANADPAGDQTQAIVERLLADPLFAVGKGKGLLGALSGDGLQQVDEEYFQHHPGKEKPKSFPFDLYVNGFPRFLTKIKLIRNESYVNLRELCAALGVQVRFRNDDYHMPMISGREPNGILMNTSATLKIVKLPDYRTGTADSYFGSGGTFDWKLFVDITPLIEDFPKVTYEQGVEKETDFQYSFGRGGNLYIMEKDKEKVVGFETYQLRDRYYLEVDIYKEKVLPHLVDISMQQTIEVFDFFAD